MVAYNFDVRINRILDDDTLLRAVAKESAKSGAVRSQMASRAGAIQAGAKRALVTSSTISVSQSKERQQVSDAIQVIQTRDRWTRASIYAGTAIRVFIVVSPHPASVRWEHGTKRTPATNHMRVGLKSAGGG